MHHSAKLFDVNSAWTSRSSGTGWCHYRITAKQGRGSDRQVELMALGDREVRFWIDVRELKKNRNWLAGWRELRVSRVSP